MSRFKALIVDDEAPVRVITARALSRLDIDCEVASDGIDALEMLRQRPFDLVVTDLRMPNINGHQLVTELLQLSKPPVIAVLTGVVEPKLAKDLYARGADRVFYKPVDFEAFALDLSNLVRRKTSQNEASSVQPGRNENLAATEKVLEESNRHATYGQEPLDCRDGDSRCDRTNTNVEASQTSNKTPFGLAVSNRSGSARDEAETSPGRQLSASNANYETIASYASLKRIDTELANTKKVLIDLQRTVASRQNLSYINLAITFISGLMFGLIFGLFGSRFSGITSIFN